MVTGTIAGAAKLLNVSAPGISRLMKHTEDTIGVRLFNRRHGRYVPTPEARNIFDLLDTIYRRVEDLQAAIERLSRGEGRGLNIAAQPSLANVMVPRAVERLRRDYPDLEMDIEILRIEEAIDYLLLGRGEVVTISARMDHSIVDFIPLAKGRLMCIVPSDSPLAQKVSISPAEIAAEKLVGIDPNDPYGRIMAGIFDREGLAYSMTTRARFGTTVANLVAAGLGIAVCDEFTVANGNLPGLACLEIEAETRFQTYAAYRSDMALSLYAERFIEHLKSAMRGPSDEKITSC